MLALEVLWYRVIQCLWGFVFVFVWMTPLHLVSVFVVLLLCRHHSCVVCVGHVIFWINFAACSSVSGVGVCCIGGFLS